MFGRSQLIIGDDELKEYNGEEFKEGKCLQLVQCTKKAEVSSL